MPEEAATAGPEDDKAETRLRQALLESIDAARTPEPPVLRSGAFAAFEEAKADLKTAIGTQFVLGYSVREVIEHLRSELDRTVEYNKHLNEQNWQSMGLFLAMSFGALAVAIATRGLVGFAAAAGGMIVYGFWNLNIRRLQRLSEGNRLEILLLEQVLGLTAFTTHRKASKTIFEHIARAQSKRSKAWSRVVNFICYVPRFAWMVNIMTLAYFLAAIITILICACFPPDEPEPHCHQSNPASKSASSEYSAPHSGHDPKYCHF